MGHDHDAEEQIGKSGSHSSEGHPENRGAKFLIHPRRQKQPAAAQMHEKATYPRQYAPLRRHAAAATEPREMRMATQR